MMRVGHLSPNDAPVGAALLAVVSCMCGRANPNSNQIEHCPATGSARSLSPFSYVEREPSEFAAPLCIELAGTRLEPWITVAKSGGAAFRPGAECEARSR